jgi:4-amino-4-deoxychorismate lyase
LRLFPFCPLQLYVIMQKAEDVVLRTAASSNFYIFSSYLWNGDGDAQRDDDYGKHCFLPYHRDRLVSAAQALGWVGVADFLNGKIGLKRLSNAVEEHLTTTIDTGMAKLTRKIKVCIYKNTCFHVESASTPLADPRNVFPMPNELSRVDSPASQCIVKVDVEPTPTSLFTSHKTSERGQYDRARSAAGIAQEPPTLAEILLFNPLNEIMECSLSTPYFQRNDRWVTPPLFCGGNAGVTRRLALEHGLCEEQVVPVESLCHQEAIWISNGVRGFFPGSVHLQTSD